MTAWIGIVISVLAIVISTLLRREKLARLYADFFSWQDQRKQKKAGEEFIKKISRPKEKGDDSLFVVFAILFFLFVIGSGLASLLHVSTTGEFGAVGTLSLSIFLWFSLRGLVREASKRKIEWYVTFFMIMMFQMTIAGMGLLWGIATMLFVSINVPVFWAGMAGAVTFVAITWFILFLGRRGRGTQ
jgi:hypothetical protein